MPNLAPARLAEFVAAIFKAADTPADIASIVAQSLVNSDLAGHDSHGVVRVRQYLTSMRAGDIVPDARPQLIHRSGAVITVDASRGFGQLAAHWTMEQGIQLAKEHGIASAGLINCGHVGRLGEWVEMAAAADTVALAFCNGGGARGAVAPFGGAERVLGTNPIAAALPLADQAPIVLDFATSAVAEGKVRVARNRGKAIPEGWVLNAEGLPTTNPEDLYTGGMLLPAATHKGYALSILVEYMAGILTGNGSPVLPDYQPGNGVLFILLDLAAFRPVADTLQQSGALAARIKQSKTAPGFDEILLPGEPEQRTAAQRGQDGIDVDDATWQSLVEDATSLNVMIPS